MNMQFYRKLPIPQEIKEQYPVSPELKARRDACVDALKDVFSGKSNKFVFVIGPCSADNEDSVLDYISRLRTVQDKVADKSEDETLEADKSKDKRVF
jgi:3-deoxy-7-phosphoheptulonate synthase